MSTEPHALMTRMLFIDAIVGVGFPSQDIAVNAERGGLATQFDYGNSFAWNRRILETLTTDTLQELYTSLKLHEVTTCPAQHS